MSKPKGMIVSIPYAAFPEYWLAIRRLHRSRWYTWRQRRRALKWLQRHYYTAMLRLLHWEHPDLPAFWEKLEKLNARTRAREIQRARDACSNRSWYR